ncbi:MAG: drug/metabolite transporter (DMT)-like permease [Gammaproteobacteria bacterium]
MLAFALQDSIIKYLSQHYPILQVLTLRSIVTLALLVVIGLSFFGAKVLIGRQHMLLMLRGGLAFFAFTSYYLALKLIPFGTAATVYMTAPLFVTLLSGLVLREQVGIHRWFAVLTGFAAVIIMLDPGSELFRFESAIPLFSALCYAMIPILNRRIGMSEHALTMGIYTTATYLSLISVTSLVFYALPIPVTANVSINALFQGWVWIALNDIGILLVACAIFTGALLAITQAYRIAIVSTIAPFEYSYLLWAVLIGYLYFGEVPELRTLLGGATIVACGCYIIYRERQLAQLKH